MRWVIGGLIVGVVRASWGVQAAWAGAWTHEQGAGYSSASVQRDDGAFGGAWRSNAYLEYGAVDGLTLVVKAETLWRDFDAGEDRQAGLGAVRKRLWSDRGLVVSGQMGVLFGESLEGPICEGTGLETRGLVGWSGEVAGGSVWLNAESAFRNRGGCDRWKLDLAGGYVIDESWSVEAKAYSQHGDGPRSLKLELGVLLDIGKDDLGLAYRREAGSSFEEDSWIVSLSRRF